jgi:hypothetical protein
MSACFLVQRRTAEVVGVRVVMTTVFGRAGCWRNRLEESVPRLAPGRPGSTTGTTVVLERSS